MFKIFLWAAALQSVGKGKSTLPNRHVRVASALNGPITTECKERKNAFLNIPIGSCSIYGYRRHTERAENRKNKNIKRPKGKQPQAAFYCNFPFAFRIVKHRRPTNLPAG
jgi:hypothetical protein